MRIQTSRRRLGVLLVAATCITPAAAAGQGGAPGARPGVTPRSLSLADALRIAVGVSNTVRAAQAGVDRARGQHYQARAQYFPQLSGAFGYQRTIQSQFQEILRRDQPSGGSNTGSGGSPDSAGNSFGSLTKIFASPVTETITLNFAQNLFTAGRIAAANAAADAGETVALLGLDAARSQAALDVAQAYYDAVAAEQLAQIADSTLAQADRSLQHTALAHEVGSASEFDLLRARVARDNQRPVVIQARGNRDVALLRLRQLLRLPLSEPLALTTPIRDEGVVASGVALDRPIEIPGANRALMPDTTAAHRSAVRQAEAAVEAQRAALRAARWQRLPSVQVTSTYQRFGYPDGTLFPSSLGLFFPNWTVTAGFSFPLFTGGRLTGDRLVAEASLAEADATLAQARDAAALDARTAVAQLEQAQAAYAASVGTDAQAAKAYQIAEVRAQEGISTQVELQQARTQYEQARLNRVIAARDLEVARLRVAMLKDLPLQAAGARR